MQRRRRVPKLAGGVSHRGHAPTRIRPGRGGGTHAFFSAIRCARAVGWQPDKAPEQFFSLAGESARDRDLHPDGMRLIAPHFIGEGSGGNGARDPAREKYIANAALIRVTCLWAAPSAQAADNSK